MIENSVISSAYIYLDALPGTCLLSNATNNGTILLSMMINSSSPFYCQLECQMKIGCVQFNYNRTGHQCDLLSEQGISNPTLQSVTGPKMCRMKSNWIVFIKRKEQWIPNLFGFVLQDSNQSLGWCSRMDTSLDCIAQFVSCCRYR